MDGEGAETTQRAQRARQPRTVRVGVIHNGIHADDAFNDRLPEVTLLRSVRSFPTSLLRYDAIIVLTHTDQGMLQHLKKPLTRYVQLGGVLVLLGATTQGRRWLPFCEWEQEFTQSISFDTESPDGGLIFRGITDPSYLKYHSKYVGHGSIRIHVARDDTRLAWDDKDRVVMFVRHLPGRGTLLVTTLDPDYHTSIPVPGPAEEPVETTHRKAAHLLDNIVDWAIWTARSAPMHRRRHLLGWLVPVGVAVAMALFYSLPLTVFLYLTLTSARAEFSAAGRVIAAIAFLGSLASIYSLFLNFVAKKGE